MKNILIFIASILLIIGCSNKTKKTLGLVETIPDEYQVTRNKPLEVPPHYNLEEIDNVSVGKSNLNKISQSEQALLNEAE